MSLGGVIFGAVVGAFVAGPVGAIVGAGVGAWLTQKGDQRAQSGAGANQWLQHFFRCLGKLAKSDGRVSEDEVAFVKSLLDEWNLDKETRQILIACFNEGRDTAQHFELLVMMLKRNLPPVSNPAKFRCDITAIFCTLVAVDRVADPNELDMLRKAAVILGSEWVVDDFFARTGNGPDPAEPPKAVQLEECYRILGVTPEATDQEVKKAYRKKAVAFHPDKAQGAGLTERQIQQAKVKFQELTNAYDEICRARGIK